MVKILTINDKNMRYAEPKPGVSYQIFDTEVTRCNEAAVGFQGRSRPTEPRSKPSERSIISNLLQCLTGPEPFWLSSQPWREMGLRDRFQASRP
jgi:hypothetical protein